MEKTQADYVREFREKQLAAAAKQSSEVVAPAVIVFKAGLFEHVAETPMYFGSRKALRDYTRANGMTSDYAE